MESAKDYLIDTIKNRRSVYPKDFKAGIKIKDKVIEKILGLAIWAPTHKLTQPWFFKVFRNEGVTQFFDKQAEIYKEITPKEIFSKRKADKYAVKAEQVSHVIVIILNIIILSLLTKWEKFSNVVLVFGITLIFMIMLMVVSPNVSRNLIWFSTIRGYQVAKAVTTVISLAENKFAC